MFQSGQPPPVEMQDRTYTPHAIILFLLLLLALQLKEKARNHVGTYPRYSNNPSLTVNDTSVSPPE